ncbi:MAG: halocin C8-like domain-containing protein [Archaeoglobaceae archaeon]
MLGSLVAPVMAKKAEVESENSCSEITLKRIVEVEIAKNGKAILNITEVNKSLSEWIAENFKESSCQDQSCLAFDYQVETKEIYNYSNNGKKLTFSEVRIYNESSSFDFKVLSYFAETATYNLSLVTRMMQVEGENYFVTAINVAPKDEKKFAPFADVIEIKSKAKLSEHYRILAEVLNEIRKQDETSWVWNKAKLELGYLSRVVERNLAEFNVEGKGAAFVLDNSFNCNLCWALASALCAALASGVSQYLACSTVCAPVCVAFVSAGGVGYLICLAVCQTSCNTLLRVIIGAGVFTACSAGAGWICSQAGLC